MILLETVASLCQGERGGGQVRTLASEDPSPSAPASLRPVMGFGATRSISFLRLLGPIQQREGEGACLVGGLLPEPHSVTESGQDS